VTAHNSFPCVDLPAGTGVRCRPIPFYCATATDLLIFFGADQVNGVNARSEKIERSQCTKSPSPCSVQCTRHSSYRLAGAATGYLLSPVRAVA